MRCFLRASFSSFSIKNYESKVQSYQILYVAEKKTSTTSQPAEVDLHKERKKE